MTRKSLQLTLSNDSSVSLRSSPGHPPVLQKLTSVGPLAPHNFVLETGGTTTVKLECEDAVHRGSAFLTYFVGGVGDSLMTIVVWVCMKPKAGADIRFGIFDEDPKFDHGVLEKVSQEEIKPETVGLGKEFLWKFEDNTGRMHEINLVTDITSNDRQYEARLNIRVPIELSDDLPPRSTYGLTDTALGTLIFDRVHEDAAISSLISAKIDGFQDGTTYIGILGRGSEVIAPASWEFIRGVLWNDDPACDFFNDFSSSNGDFRSWDEYWSYNFNKEGTITYRSHHGDLQFLHAMASTVDEQPGETRRKILLWIEVMYKLSVGDGITESSKIDSTGLKEFFDDTTTPKGSETLRDLLVGTTPTSWDTDIQRRALELDNPGDMIDVEFTNYRISESLTFIPWVEPIYIKGFPKEKPGRFSNIKTFHCYNGQGDGRHGRYDSIPDHQELNPSDPTSFYCIAGANNGALEACTALATEWKAQTPWDSTVKTAIEGVFKLTDDVTPSDTKVDEHLWAWKKPDEF